MLYKFFNRLAGAVAGFFSGIATGFVVSAKDTVLHERAHSWPILIAFFVSVPFYMAVHAMKGSYAGATQGLEAGIDYFNTVLSKKFARKMADSLSKLNLTDLLTEKEVKAYKLHLASMPEGNKQERMQKLKLEIEFDEYILYINQKCNGKKISELKKPIKMHAEGCHEFVVELDAFKKNVDECVETGGVINGNPSSSHATSFYTPKIIGFVNKVRRLMNEILRRLGEEQILANHRQRPPANQPMSTASLMGNLGSSKDDLTSSQSRVIEPSAPQSYVASPFGENPQCTQPGSRP